MRTLARLSSGRVQVSQVAPRFAFGALFLFRGARVFVFFNQWEFIFVRHYVRMWFTSECGVNIILSCGKVSRRDDGVLSHLAYGFYYDSFTRPTPLPSPKLRAAAPASVLSSERPRLGLGSRSRRSPQNP